MDTKGQDHAVSSAAPPVDGRGAKRSSLMLRAAKLLGENGEYVCLIRDVSETGTKLRLFHAPPPETHLFLELANGDRHAMERVWHRDDHAGFRFSCSIDVERFIREEAGFPRRPLRLRLHHAARVTIEGAEGDVQLVDMSQHGACMAAGRRLAIGQKLRLDVEGIPARVGFVRWRRDDRHGLVFQQAFRLDELARYALGLQPFASSPDTAVPATAPLVRCA